VATPLTLNTFTRTGYSFSGWNTASGGGGTVYADGATYPFTQSATLYAQWTPNASGPPPSGGPPSGGPPSTPSPPTVTGISPSSGPVMGGVSVTITGTGFSTIPGDTTVDFGTAVAPEVSCSSATSCTAVAPSEAAATVALTVTTSNGTSTTSPADQFTYVPVPVVAKITPASGPTRGGTKVTIQGSNLLGTFAVHFGTKSATSVRVVSSSEITVVAPSGSGTVYVSVSTVGGSNQVTATSKYTYVPPPTISRVTPVGGSSKAGRKVTIWGANFVGKVTVSFGGRRGTAVRVVSSSEITVTVPPGSGTVHVTVTALGGSSRMTETALYSY
jgi:uncharacterized repeat protein (TIGR02543 family)